MTTLEIPLLGMLMLSHVPARASPTLQSQMRAPLYMPLPAEAQRFSRALPPHTTAITGLVISLIGSSRSLRGSRRSQKHIVRVQPDEPGDALIPPMPIGRLVTKGEVGALEYDPSDAPEFISDEFGTGEFSWQPVTPEGGLLAPGEYLEEAFPVPSDRIDYLIEGGWLEPQQDEDYRTYVDDDVVKTNNRNWQTVVLRGSRDSVRVGSLRLMTGLFHRRPWDGPAALPSAA